MQVILVTITPTWGTPLGEIVIQMIRLFSPFRLNMDLDRNLMSSNYNRIYSVLITTDKFILNLFGYE